MATIYVRSTDGSDSDDGSTWALAKATLQGAMAAASAGDTIYVSQAHAEAAASTKTIVSPGTENNPVWIICANDSAEPPTATATTATVTTTGNAGINLQGSFYCYGVSFLATTGSATGELLIAQTSACVQTFENCVLKSNSTSSGGRTLRIGPDNTGRAAEVTCINTDFGFEHANHVLRATNATVKFFGGSLVGEAITRLFEGPSSGRACVIESNGLDLSAGASTMSLALTSSGFLHMTHRGTVLPASWSGGLLTGTMYPSYDVGIYGCVIDGGSRIGVRTQSYAGTVRDETTVVRTGGAAESWCMVSDSTATRNGLGVESPEIIVPLTTTGSPVTITVEVITDGVTLTDAEAYIEVLYRGTSGSPVLSIISDAPADPIATPANQATSSETWTTTGLSSPVKQALAVTFTPEDAGDAIIRVYLRKASTTMYVCPLAEVS